MNFAADLPLFFAEFGTPATVGGVCVTGIYDAASALALGLVVGTGPQLIVADTVAAQEGTVVVIGPQPHVVTEVRDDGTGLRTLLLQTP